MSRVLSPTPYVATEIVTPPAARLAVFETQALRVEEQGKGKGYWWLGGVVIALHAAVIVGFANRDASPALKPQKHEIEIAFVKPEVEPPPPVEPPKPPPPPPPKVQRVAPPPPQPVQQLRTAPATQDIAPDDLTVRENTEAPKSTGPVEAAPEPVPPAPAAVPAPPAPPSPPAPKVEEPITEATANAAYLNNPKPDYPGVASRNGWGGTVILRVRVLADGHAEGVEVKKSSGRKVLDEAAIAAVKRWTFVPSKRGSTPIDGWATVPIVFNPDQ
jgi:protein TonB